MKIFVDKLPKEAKDCVFSIVYDPECSRTPPLCRIRGENRCVLPAKGRCPFLEQGIGPMDMRFC